MNMDSGFRRNDGEGAGMTGRKKGGREGAGATDKGWEVGVPE